MELIFTLCAKAEQADKGDLGIPRKPIYNNNIEGCATSVQVEGLALKVLLTTEQHIIGVDLQGAFCGSSGKHTHFSQ